VNLEGQTLDIYALGSELGRGGMGVVYKAETTADGRAGLAGSIVAVKVFHPHLVEDDRAFDRFVREAEIGESLRHPNVVRTFCAGQAEADGELYHFMVMEFIEGQTLGDLCAELGTFPDHLLYQVADQALDALASIHERGIIHRDIKPENIVITREHRVLLMDLGVARLIEHGHTLTQAGEFVGSLPYAAPEQFDASAELGPNCDIYSFGVVLYELATGQNPFDTEELGTLLQQKLQGEVERPKLCHPDVDVFWDEVIVSCVEREAAKRFTSATELRSILSEGQQSEWWRRKSEGRVLPGAERALKRMRLVREAPLVGRKEELSRLHDAYRSAQSGEGRIVLLGAPAGAGKSRLVYNFVEELSSSTGPLVLAGRAVGPGGRAYQPFLEAIHDLLGIDEMEADGRRARLEGELARLLPDTPGVVGRLADFLLVGLKPDEASGFTKDALLASFADLLRRSAADRPVIVAIEDMHLAGSESLDLFAYLARCLPGHRILLLAIYDEDEVEEGEGLQKMLTGLTQRDETGTLGLPPLSRASCDEMVLSIVADERTVRSIGDLLHRKSDGNPNIILEMLSHLRSVGVLVQRNGSLVVEGEPEEASLPDTVTDLISLKLGRLDEEQRETLEAAAVLGHEFEASLLAAVLEERRIKLLKRLAILERKYRLIRSAGKDSFTFAKRQIQEAVYEGISPALRSEYHSVVADAIQETYVEPAAEEGVELPGKTAFLLVRHLLLAQRALEGEPHLERALEYLGGHYHASSATPFLERLADDFSVARAPSRFAIAMARWAFYEVLGRSEDQRRVLEEARGFADDIGEPGKRGQIHSRLAATLWYSGNYDEAGNEAEQGLALAKEAGDRRWESNSMHTLGGVAWRRGNPSGAASLWREALEIRRLIGDRRGEASSLMALAVVMPMIGEGAESLTTKQAALKIFREIGERRGEAALLNNIGCSLEDASRQEEALDHLKRAALICREIGDEKLEATVLCNLGRTHRALGEVEEAKRNLDAALAVFSEIGHPGGELDVRILLAATMAQYGGLDEAESQLRQALETAKRTGSKAKMVEAHRVLGILLHGRGERSEGWKHLETAHRLALEINSSSDLFSTLSEMGSASLAEADFERACGLFTEAREQLAGIGSGSSLEILTLSRLARALMGAGKKPEAAKLATESQRLLEESAPISPEDAPEIHYHLWAVLEDEGQRRVHLSRAQESLRARSRTIRNAAYREHFLTKSGYNPEILAEAERILGG
jgi:tetratricopeptide (TPR) repeat protein/predicted Ser/Thr protein kinase